MAELVEDQDGAPYPEPWQPTLQTIRDAKDDATAKLILIDLAVRHGGRSGIVGAARVAYRLRSA
jgi:hypothetical protein